MPKISIIVPVYNVEVHLPQCMKSLRKQTLDDLEIILVDDESSDNCPEMCDRYAKEDCRIKVIHKKNEGLGFARNTGLAVATGEYVAFTDSDDYELSETYEKLYQMAVSTKSDVVYYKFIKDRQENQNISFYNQDREIKDLLLNMVANPPEKRKDRSIEVSSCLGLYRRELLKQNHIKFHSERELISEDLIFNIDVLSVAAKVVVTNWQLYFYRVTPGSLTHVIRDDRFEKIKIFYYFLLNRLSELGFEKNGTLRCNRWLIGYARSSVSMIFRSNIDFIEKRKRVLSICKDDVVKQIHDEYPCKKMPLTHYLFFESMYRQNWIALWLFSKYRSR